MLLDKSVVVIGSGPSGIAAAHALLARNAAVTLIDGGGVLESAKYSAREAFSRRDGVDFGAEDLRELRRQTSDAEKHLKLVYGSDFAYRDVPGSSKLSLTNARVARSFARGGLSNVWGACVMPFDAADINDWPDEARRIGEFYPQVLEFLPRVVASDEISLRCGSIEAGLRRLPLSPAGNWLLGRFERAKSKLRAQGLTFGAAGVAVDTERRYSQSDCRECGLCLEGCPYSLIYCSMQTLEKFVRARRIEYLPGLVVQSLRENADKVEIEVVESASTKPMRISADRVFLAAGAIESTRIVAQSLDVRSPIKIRSSEKFVIPLLANGVPSRAARPGPSLCQLMMALEAGRVSKKSIHLQWYSPSEIVEKHVGDRLQSLVPFPRLRRVLARSLARRMFVVFGYLPSEISSSLFLKLTDGVVEVTGVRSSSAGKAAKSVFQLFRRNSITFGAFPLLLEMDLPGGGNHIGGSFPMRESPGDLETDVWGSLDRLRRVHIVDASVLSSIPAQTITFATMANAYRIASSVRL